MDTLKDKQLLELMIERGNGPWRVWEQTRSSPTGR